MRNPLSPPPVAVVIRSPLSQDGALARLRSAPSPVTSGDLVVEVSDDGSAVLARLHKLEGPRFRGRVIQADGGSHLVGEVAVSLDGALRIGLQALIAIAAGAGAMAVLIASGTKELAWIGGLTGACLLFLVLTWVLRSLHREGVRVRGDRYGKALADLLDAEAPVALPRSLSAKQARWRYLAVLGIVALATLGRFFVPNRAAGVGVAFLVGWSALVTVVVLVSRWKAPRVEDGVLRSGWRSVSLAEVRSADVVKGGLWLSDGATRIRVPVGWGRPALTDEAAALDVSELDERVARTVRSALAVHAVVERLALTPETAQALRRDRPPDA